MRRLSAAITFISALLALSLLPAAPARAEPWHRGVNLTAWYRWGYGCPNAALCGGSGGQQYFNSAVDATVRSLIDHGIDHIAILANGYMVRCSGPRPNAVERDESNVIIHPGNVDDTAMINSLPLPAGLDLGGQTLAGNMLEQIPDDSSLEYMIARIRTLYGQAGKPVFIAIKPHVDCLDGTERSKLVAGNFPDWWRNYTGFIDHFAGIAQRQALDMFVVGTELTSATLSQIAEPGPGLPGPVQASASVSGTSVTLDYDVRLSGTDRIAAGTVRLDGASGWQMASTYGNACVANSAGTCRLVFSKAGPAVGETLQPILGGYNARLDTATVGQDPQTGARTVTFAAPTGGQRTQSTANDEWAALVGKLREAGFTGKVTFAANHFAGPVDLGSDFWQPMDYVGVDAYERLENGTAAPGSVDAVAARWYDPRYSGSATRKLMALARETGKEILFTEVGYPSTLDALKNPWGTDFSGSQLVRNLSQSAQQTAYRALFEVWGSQPLLRGTYLWNWMVESSAPADTGDLWIRGKKAAATVRSVYADPALGQPLTWSRSMIPVDRRPTVDVRTGAVRSRGRVTLTASIGFPRFGALLPSTAANPAVAGDPSLDCGSFTFAIRRSNPSWESTSTGTQQAGRKSIAWTLLPSSSTIEITVTPPRSCSMVKQAPVKFSRSPDRFNPRTRKWSWGSWRRVG